MRAARSLSPRTAMVLAALAALVVYAGTLGNDFAWDDTYNVVDNPSIRSLANVPSYFGSHWAADATDAFARDKNVAVYRPLTQVSYAIDYALFGLSPQAYHATNNLLHALVAALVAGLAWRLFGSVLAALLAGLWFAVHTVNAEAVSVITYRTTLLAATFYLTAIHAHLAAADRTGRPRALLRWLVVPLAFAAAMMAKETGITLVATLILLDRTVLKDQPWRTQLPHQLLLVALAAGYMGLRAALLKSSPFVFFPGADLPTIVYTMLKVPALYARLLIVPHPLNPFRDWTVFPPVSTIADPEVIAGLAVVILWAIGFVVAWRRRPAVAWCLGLLAISLTPYMQLKPFITVGGERFLYVGSAGLAAALGYGLSQLWATRETAARKLPARLALVAFTAWLLLLSALTVSRTADWQNTETILRATIHTHPTAFNSRFALGQYLAKDARPAEAADAFEGAVNVLPKLRAARLWLAVTALDSGQPQRAATALEAFEGAWQDPEILALLTRAYTALGDTEGLTRAQAAQRRLGPGN